MSDLKQIAIGRLVLDNFRTSVVLADGHAEDGPRSHPLRFGADDICRRSGAAKNARSLVPGRHRTAHETAETACRSRSKAIDAAYSKDRRFAQRRHRSWRESRKIPPCARSMKKRGYVQRKSLSLRRHQVLLAAAGVATNVSSRSSASSCSCIALAGWETLHPRCASK